VAFIATAIMGIFIYLIYFKMNIYVGNLHYGVTEDELTEAFGKFGTVNSVKVITDKYSGQSKGFGFIEMEDDTEGNKAVSELNGVEITMLSLKTKFYRKRCNRPSQSKYFVTTQPRKGYYINEYMLNSKIMLKN
jgi:RNA recognition motif-containing protein